MLEIDGAPVQTSGADIVALIKGQENPLQTIHIEFAANTTGNNTS